MATAETFSILLDASADQLEDFARRIEVMAYDSKLEPSSAEDWHRHQIAAVRAMRQAASLLRAAEHARG